MRTIYFIALLFTLSISDFAEATVRTVNNNNPSPGQYTTLGAAISAAVTNDTIYISGSPTSYSAGTLTKSLTFIGTGHNPDKQNPLVSTIGNLVIQTGGAGSRFIGITIPGGSTIMYGNVTFENCSLGGIEPEVPGLNIICKKCVFTGPINVTWIAGTTTSSVTLSNCILTGTMNAYNGGTLSGSATNCLFLGNALATVATSLSNFTFANCIFYGTSPQIASINTSNSFTKCLSFNCPNNTFGGTTNTNNLTNQNPLFTTFASPGFHYTDNYILQAVSPGHNYGTDGKDIGLYGGAEGIYFRMGGEPAIPQIRQMNVSNSTVPAGTPLNINIISTRKSN